MRLLFLFLVLMNGLIYLWYNFYQQPVHAASVTMNSSAPKLVLLSEQAMMDEKSADADTPLTTRADVKKSQTGKQCYTLGPFMTNESVASASEKLMLSGRPFEKSVSEKKEQIGYWVFMPPMKTRDEAVNKAEELRLLGDTQFYVVQQPAEYENAVSLGVFRSKANAKRRFLQLKNFGYEVKLEGRYRQNPVYWLNYSEQENSKELNTDNFIGAQRLPTACEVIASSEPLP